MKRKLLALLVCMALLVSGLTAATADGMETVTTISLKGGPLMGDLGDVAKVLDMASIRIHSMSDELGAFVLSLNNKDVFKSLFKMEQNGVYVQSGVFGPQPLYFTWEDIQAFINQQTQSALEMNTLDQETAMLMQSMMDGTLTEEQMNSMMGFDEELVQLAKDIDASATSQEGTFFVEGSDAASLKTVTVLTGEDVVRVIRLPMMRNQLVSQLALSNPEMTQAELDQQVDEELAMMEEEILKSNILITMTVYTSDEELIAFTLDLTAEMEDYNGVKTPVGVYAQLTRTSIDTAKFYQFSLTLSQGDESFLNQAGSLYMGDTYSTGNYTLFSMPNEPMLQIAMNCDREVEDRISADMSITAFDSYSGEAQSVYLILDQRKAENVTDTMIDVYLGGAVDEIKAELQEARLISMNINTVMQSDSGFFDAVLNATPESSMQLLTMTDDELDTYMLTLQNGLMMTVLNVIDNLPPEMSESLMQSMGSGSF